VIACIAVSAAAVDVDADPLAVDVLAQAVAQTAIATATIDRRTSWGGLEWSVITESVSVRGERCVTARAPAATIRTSVG
jgi:hypothetical protein